MLLCRGEHCPGEGPSPRPKWDVLTSEQADNVHLLGQSDVCVGELDSEFRRSAWLLITFEGRRSFIRPGLELLLRLQISSKRRTGPSRHTTAHLLRVPDTKNCNLPLKRNHDWLGWLARELTAHLWKCLLSDLHCMGT